MQPVALRTQNHATNRHRTVSIQYVITNPPPGGRGKNMPVISKFYGIVIRMLCVRPLGARFHAFYRNWELVVGIWPLRVVQGEAPSWVREMVLSWAAQHQQELLTDWNRCQNHQQPLAIAPVP